ncbi:hypothetical protein FACS18949_04180 [Clostridia bacterium]|nr:hypothetical protein FACS18949_04180 [Clostridia bacterium]
MKKLNINCGNAVILRYDPAVFEGYDAISINAGSALISAAAYADLQKKQFSLNSGSNNVVEVSGKVVKLEKDTVIDKQNYDGCFLFSEGTVWLTAGAKLDKITGLYARNLFYPESYPIESLPSFSAKNHAAFPDGAVIVTEDITLDSRLAERWAENSVIWTHKAVLAAEGLDVLERRGIKIHCSKLTVYDADARKYGGVFKSGKVVVVPDGCEIISGDLTLTGTTIDEYGEKIFVDGDLFVALKDAESVKDFEVIRVTGEARIPSAAAKAFRAVGKAGSIKSYRGTFRAFNGKNELSHAALRTAAERGIQYTLEVNGMLTFADDVTPDDLDCILALDYNGAIVAADSISGVLQGKVGEGNGTFLRNLPERLAPKDDENTSNINMGSYIVI